MSDHELWNELGNLYFLNGAYEPAIRAYLCSIELESKCGRSYSNLAMAFVQIGKYNEAIKLYRHSIELLSDEKEKAITLNRLGILYLQIKDYDNALDAYQQSDLLNAEQDAEESKESACNTDLPLSISAPGIEIDAIIGASHLPKPISSTANLVEEINAAFILAEEQCSISWFEGELPPPDPEKCFKTGEAVHESLTTDHSEWELAYADETTSVEMHPKAQEETGLDVIEDGHPIVSPDFQVEADFDDTRNKSLGVDNHQDELVDVGYACGESADVNDLQNILMDVDDVQNDAEGMVNPSCEDTSRKGIMELPMEMIGAVGKIVEKVEEGIPSIQSELSYDNSSITESVDVVAASETEPASTQYSQVEYPLMELSPAERELLELDIAKYKCETENNPYNHTVWKKLGDAYKAAGMYKDAIPTFQTAISLNRLEPSYHYRLGLIFAAERREAEALLEFHRVLELDADYAEAHASLASHYRKMGLEELAQFHIEKALNAKLENESEYNRACLEAICGNYDRALELLEIALQSRQTYVNWIQNDPDLDVLRDDRRFHELVSTYAASEQL